ncbi:MAG: hypothetical protein ACFE8M_10635 [Candidatus Hermodarchaeota archaeon]
MSIKKWLTDDTIGDDRKKREEEYNKLSKEEKAELKKKKLQQIIQKHEKEKPNITKPENFLNEVMKFKEWLDDRNYIKGDLVKIEMWIKNLYRRLESNYIQNQSQESNISKLKQKYAEIPLAFLDEKTRIALNKKLRNVNRTASDNYYLRKLKEIIKERLKEAEYYETLRKIIEI